MLSLNQYLIVGVGFYVAYELAINFQNIKLKITQIAKGGCPRTKIIQRKADVQLPQAQHLIDGAFWVAH